MKKVGVILSGCGVFDGSEIHEAVLTLLALDRHDADVAVFAPDTNQREVINHVSGKATGESRNALIESARIARGNILSLDQASPEDIDAAIFPGGYGVAKNLCDFAMKGTDCTPNSQVSDFIVKCLKKRKPMGFMCIAPVLLANISGKMNLTIEMTIGKDVKTADSIRAMGAHHIEADVDDIVVDLENRIVTTPAYMLGQRIRDVATGIERLVEKVLGLCE
jgi:enhancing lycopene biosynthesis protein 2